MRGLSKAAALLSSLCASASIIPSSRVPESVEVPDYVIGYSMYLAVSVKALPSPSSSRSAQMSPKHPSSSECLSLFPRES